MVITKVNKILMKGDSVEKREPTPKPKANLSKCMAHIEVRRKEYLKEPGR